jgi:hypothetical protein
MEEQGAMKVLGNLWRYFPQRIQWLLSTGKNIHRERQIKAMNTPHKYETP